MARTVKDMVGLLDVIAGYDDADPATSGCKEYSETCYKPYLRADGLKGKRLGVLRQAFPPHASDSQVVALLDAAVADLEKAGAEIVDPFEILDFTSFPANPHPMSEVRDAIEAYLAKTGPKFPKTLKEVVASDKYHPVHEGSLKLTAVAPAPSEDPVVHALEELEIRMRATYKAAMEAQRIDAFILPVASYPPKLNGDRNVNPAGANTWIASGLHWPAMSVPMGYTYEDLPSGLQIVAQPWQEGTLIEIAYAYEQATGHRKPPATTPPLGRE